jgi:hypothetical protein
LTRDGKTTQMPMVFMIVRIGENGHWYIIGPT